MAIFGLCFDEYLHRFGGSGVLFFAYGRSAPAMCRWRCNLTASSTMNLYAFLILLISRPYSAFIDLFPTTDQATVESLWGCGVGRAEEQSRILFARALHIFVTIGRSRTSALEKFPFAIHSARKLAWLSDKMRAQALRAGKLPASKVCKELTYPCHRHALTDTVRREDLRFSPPSPDQTKPRNSHRSFHNSSNEQSRRQNSPVLEATLTASPSPPHTSDQTLDSRREDPLCPS